MDVQPSDVMTVEQAAEFMRVGRTKVYELIRCDGLPVIRLGRRVIVLKQQLLSWLEKQGQNGAAR